MQDLKLPLGVVRDRFRPRYEPILSLPLSHILQAFCVLCVCVCVVRVCVLCLLRLWICGSIDAIVGIKNETVWRSLKWEGGSRCARLAFFRLQSVDPFGLTAWDLFIVVRYELPFRRPERGRRPSRPCSHGATVCPLAPGSRSSPSTATWRTPAANRNTLSQYPTRTARAKRRNG